MIWWGGGEEIFYFEIYLINVKIRSIPKSLRREGSTQINLFTSHEYWNDNFNVVKILQSYAVLIADTLSALAYLFTFNEM